MNAEAAISSARNWLSACANGWDRFWFTPRLPNTLALLRVLTGAMLLYMHLVLASELMSFLGDEAWVNNETAKQLHDGTWFTSNLGRSYLWHISSPFLLWVHQLFAIVVTAAFMVGFMTRITAPLAWFLQLMFLHRLTGHLFGLDQIATYSVMYLMLAPCGACYSVDAWLREKWADRRKASPWLQFLLPDDGPSVAANVATRLFQIHLCVIYLFGGLAKARGEAWWDGTAVWFAVGNYEYQSVDMTWMASYPMLFSALTHVTLFWEVFYCALVWPRLTRPLVLLIAVAVHGGIAMFLGMITFGLMMIAANMIFVEPEWIIALSNRGKRLREADDTEPAPLSDDALDEIDDEHVADFDDEEFHVPDQDDLTLDDAPALSQSDDDLEVALPEAADELRAVIQQREQTIREAREKLRKREQVLNEREELYRERVDRLKSREAKIRDLVEKRRAKTDEQSP